MMDAREAAALKPQEASGAGPQERLIRQLRTRNAELENTNRLLLREIAESRRAERARRGGEEKDSGAR